MSWGSSTIRSRRRSRSVRPRRERSCEMTRGILAPAGALISTIAVMSLVPAVAAGQAAPAARPAAKPAPAPSSATSEVDRAAHALGRSRSAGKLHQQERAVNALRTAERVRGKTNRRCPGRRIGRHPARAPGAGDQQRASARRGCPCAAALVGSLRYHQGQPAVAGRRTGRWQDPADDAGRTAARRRPCGRRRGGQARPRSGRRTRGPQPV